MITTTQKTANGTYKIVSVWDNGITTETRDLNVTDLIKILISKGVLKDEDIA